MSIQVEHWEEMLADVRRRAPQEACGLVAGERGRTSRVIPVTTDLDSPVRFRMDPREQLNALLEIEESGSQLLAIYHSHPGGPAAPSPTDVAEAAYPGVVHLIWHSQAGIWECSGFLIEERQVSPVIIKVIPSPAAS